jgi:outer membrane lipoprotein LolB
MSRVRRAVRCRSAAAVPWILAATLLAACVATRPPTAPAAQSWPERRAALQSLDRFALWGRVAVASGAEGFNGGLRWEQQDALSRVEIDGPFGAGGVHIESEGAHFTLATSRGDRLDGAAGRAELERRLGFALPLSSLRYWIVGVPDPGAPSNEVLDPQLRLAMLEQGGWRVSYPRYVVASDRWLPKRVTVERGGARVRLIVDRWEP